VNSRDLSGFSHRELFTIRLRLPGGSDRSAPTPLCPTLPLELAREKPDVILAEGGSNIVNNVLVYLYAFLTGTPIVWWTLGELRRSETSLSIPQRLFRSLVRWMERRSSALLGYSSVAIDYFQRNGYDPAKQFRAVNCIDTDLANARMEAARERSLGLKEELGLAGKRILLFVGALTEGKRLEDLGQVYARLKQSRPDLCLLIVGDGAYRSTLESHFANAGTPDVLFTGQVIDDVSAYFLIGDIFVLPGLGGLAVSEALVHGLPVVSAEADGCEVDLVEEGKNGYRIETGDLETLHDRIAELLDDEAKRSSMAARSKWIVKNRFNINSYMENLIAALDYAVESSRSKRA